MAIIIEKTNIDGLLIIHPHKHDDNRGYFLKDFEIDFFKENNLFKKIVELNESKSKKGVLRGLHFQVKFAQSKLVRVISGSVFDVVVDLRKDSMTFGKYFSIVLSDTNNLMLYIPRGFAHGYLSLEDDTIFSYKCDNYYSPSHDSGIKWDDKELSIKWPIEIDEDLVSSKDSTLCSLEDFRNEYEGFIDDECIRK
jgi:dTDP-4-dehydrorhamnose 3,5-epimerase